MINFSDFLFESKSLSNVNYILGDNYSISFEYKGQKIKTPESKIFRNVFKNVVDWLYKNGYKFDEEVIGRKLFKKGSVPSNYEGKGIYYIPSTEYAILCNQPAPQSIKYVIIMLTRFGVDSSTINIITPELESDSRPGDESLNPEIQDIPDEEIEVDKVEKIKIYSKNPFRQSICVLGESGAGKSVTIENILESEGHEFEFIIPSASTTGLLSQFSPSKSGYVQSRLGRMIVESFNNPTTLYTAVFDECHKSNIIEMINDELLQAISIKRNMGKRFISLDEDTSELYKGVETFRGNILIPDNFGFIFISSKPRIISNNTDFFNRVNLVVLKSYEEEKIQTSDELLSKVLPEEEKMKLASTRND